MSNPNPSSPAEQKLYVATAGGPGGAKSTELDLELEEGDDPRYKNLIMVDPDRYVLEYMNHTYRPMMGAGVKARLGIEKASQAAYERSRPGSNIIASSLLNEAYNSGYNIAHGTTMTSPHSGAMLKTLGDAGYERKLFLSYSKDDVRLDATKSRIDKEANYQVDPSDIKEKGKLFPQRMADYFTHGDHLVLLWKNAIEERAVKAAEYKNGRRVILDQDAYDNYVARYEEHRAELSEEGIDLPDWASVQQIYFERGARCEITGMDKPAGNQPMM